MTDWIPCSERLPQINEPVRDSCGPGRGQSSGVLVWVQSHHEIAYLNNEDREPIWHIGYGRPAYQLSEVTHWMPLPDSPQRRDERT